MQGAEAVEAAVAEQAQPVGQLPHAPAEQAGDLDTSLALGNPEHGGEAFIDALVARLVAALEFLALLGAKMNRLHRAPPGPAVSGGQFLGGDHRSQAAGIMARPTSLHLQKERQAAPSSVFLRTALLGD